jgi:hypothetical protein
MATPEEDLPFSQVSLPLNKFTTNAFVPEHQEIFQGH